MRNRPALLGFGLALSLVIGSTIVFLLRADLPVASTTSCWKITRLQNGAPGPSVLRHEIPNDPAIVFPESTCEAAVTYQVERVATTASTATTGWFSSHHFSDEDLRTIEFLLMLPPAALLVCFFRNVIGLSSFGTFAPALLGLAFREVHSLLGVFVVLTIVTAGWWLRRGLNTLHLLQVPRTSLLLSCVVVMILLLLSATRGAGPRAITLFPLVILTGMIERFWTMEEEEGAASSIATLAATLLMAACVWMLAAIPAAPAWMLAHPEILGYVMAGQIFLGRYTGFRLIELYRFRSLMADHE